MIFMLLSPVWGLTQEMRFLNSKKSKQSLKIMRFVMMWWYHTWRLLSGMHPRPRVDLGRPTEGRTWMWSGQRDRLIPLGLVKYAYGKLLGPYRVELCNCTRLGLGLVTLPSRVYKGGQGPPSNRTTPSASKINTNKHTGRRVLRNLAVRTCLNRVPCVTIDSLILDGPYRIKDHLGYP